jgi:pyruvate/2-oxoglutarate dehydrogenase complex dihydrolipoamide dehydrogenase (E3) component
MLAGHGSKLSNIKLIFFNKLIILEPHLNYLTIPGVIYTHPEVATVGYTEE